MENSEDSYEILHAKVCEALKKKTALSFMGGGALGPGHIGQLEQLYDYGGFRNVEYLVGASVGSIMAVAIAASKASGMDPEAQLRWMKKVLFGLDLTQFEDNDAGLLRDVYRLIKKYGWNKGEAITEWMEEIMEFLLEDKDITLKQLYERSGIHTVINYYSCNYRRTMYADHITKPHWRVADTVRKSSSIPIYYAAVFDKREGKDDEVILDGGTMDNNPIHVLRKLGVPPENIMGLIFVSDEEIATYDEHLEEKLTDHGEPDKITGFLTDLIGEMRELAMRMHVHKRDWMLTSYTNVHSMKSTDFTMTEDQKKMLYEEGRAGMQRFAAQTAKLITENEYPTQKEMSAKFAEILQNAGVLVDDVQLEELYKKLEPFFNTRVESELV